MNSITDRIDITIRFGSTDLEKLKRIINEMTDFKTSAKSKDETLRQDFLQG
ncbi:MAG: hypothetical protein ACE5H4_10585 [Candidatus Thorarchaeota archaeon]